MVYKSVGRCLLCNGAPVQASGVCAPCCAELPWLAQACRHCALPLPPSPIQGTGACARCLQLPPSFSRAHAAWHYAFPVGQLVQRFKYRKDLAAGHSLAQLAADHLRPQTAPDLLLPIPLHWRRFLGRGYNQAQLIAEQFARAWRIPLAPRLLRKHTYTGTQQQLDRAQRLGNLRHSFRAGGQVAGLHIGLVDDVITTGATLEAAAQTLLAAGTAEVSAFALARVP